MLYGKHYVLPSSITTHFLLTAKFCSLSASSCLSRLFRRHYEGHLPHSGMIDRPFFPGSSFILVSGWQVSRLLTIKFEIEIGLGIFCWGQDEESFFHQFWGDSGQCGQIHGVVDRKLAKRSPTMQDYCFKSQKSFYCMRLSTAEFKAIRCEVSDGHWLVERTHSSSR